MLGQNEMQRLYQSAPIQKWHYRFRQENNAQTTLNCWVRQNFNLLYRALHTRLWLAIPFLAIPALWPFYKIGLPRSFDGGLHLLRLGVLDYHLRHGVLFPRWVPEMMLGYGYPLFNFYAPSTYYLAEALHLLGFSFYMAFLLAFVIVILAAGLGMYQLAKDIFGADQRWSALVAATAYMTAPYLLTEVVVSSEP